MLDNIIIKCVKSKMNNSNHRLSKRLYFDENMPSVVYNVCQMYAKISQMVASHGDTKVFFPVIFSKFDVEVEFN